VAQTCCLRGRKFKMVPHIRKVCCRQAGFVYGPSGGYLKGFQRRGGGACGQRRPVAGRSRRCWGGSNGWHWGEVRGKRHARRQGRLEECRAGGGFFPRRSQASPARQGTLSVTARRRGGAWPRKPFRDLCNEAAPFPRAVQPLV
jgi:hypothetical protein